MINGSSGEIPVISPAIPVDFVAVEAQEATATDPTANATAHEHQEAVTATRDITMAAVLAARRAHQMRRRHSAMMTARLLR